MRILCVDVRVLYSSNRNPCSAEPGVQVDRLTKELKDAQGKVVAPSTDDQSNKDLAAKVAQLRRSLKYATFEYTQGKQQQMALVDEVR